MSKMDDERFWNLIIYKMYLTNKERDEIMPALGCLLGFGLLVWFIGFIVYTMFKA